MRKAYIVDIPGSDKSITVTELTDKTKIIFQVGCEKVVLVRQPWEELMHLDSQIIIYHKETDYERYDIRSARKTDPSGEGMQTSCAKLDWDDQAGKNNSDESA